MDLSMWCSCARSRTKSTSRSMWSAVDIFNTLRMFTKEPIREQEIKLECMKAGFVKYVSSHTMEGQKRLKVLMSTDNINTIYDMFLCILKLTKMLNISTFQYLSICTVLVISFCNKYIGESLILILSWKCSENNHNTRGGVFNTAFLCGITKYSK